MTTTNAVTFGKFNQDPHEDCQSEILINGDACGFITQVCDYKDVGHVQAVYRKQVIGYLVEAIDGLDDEYVHSTLKSARDAVRKHLATPEGLASALDRAAAWKAIRARR